MTLRWRHRSKKTRYILFVIQIETTFTYDYDSNPERVSMTIHVSKTPDKKLCLSFVRNSGQPIYFKRLVVLIKGEFRNS